jgi:hypothetical protein
MDGTTWNSDAFICEVDDGDTTPESSENIWEVYMPSDFDDTPSRNVQPITVSLLDIARPAKAKGNFNCDVLTCEYLHPA